MDPSTSGRAGDQGKAGPSNQARVTMIGCGASHTVALLSEHLYQIVENFTYLRPFEQPLCDVSWHESVHFWGRMKWLQSLTPRLQKAIVKSSIPPRCKNSVADNRLVVSWGRGEDGQLGHGNANERPFPQTVHALTDAEIDAIFCGAEYSAAVSSSRKEVYSWGWGDFGRLGHGDIIDAFLPKPIQALSGIGITRLACGDTHTLAMTGEGRLFSFGRNQNGQLGIGTDKDSLSPVPVESLQGCRVRSVACGAEHSLVCMDSGQVFAWGWGRYGNLGLGEKSDRWLPTLVPGLESQNIVRVACGWRHSVVVDDVGKIWTFGWSRYGQLGHGDNIDEARAKQVKALEGVGIGLISGGWRHTIVADMYGKLYAWGWNKFGQLGINSLEDKNLPTPVVSPLTDATVVALACGWRHNFAVTAEGDVYSWGRGGTGQLGHGGTEDLLAPKLMEDLSARTIRTDVISARGPPPSEGAAYIPFADRYAVVPDHASQDATFVVPEVAQPEIKRPRI